jgi:hypothetical protein
VKSERLKEFMLENAEKIRSLKAQVDETVRTRDRSSEDRRKWELACATFHSRYDALAFPGGYTGALERVLAGEPKAVEAGLCFLETHPYFFRSGYMFRDILRKMRRAPLSGSQASRFASIVSAYQAYRAKRSGA